MHPLFQNLNQEVSLSSQSKLVDYSLIQNDQTIHVLKLENREIGKKEITESSGCFALRSPPRGGSSGTEGREGRLLSSLTPASPLRKTQAEATEAREALLGGGWIKTLLSELNFSCTTSPDIWPPPLFVLTASTPDTAQLCSLPRKTFVHRKPGAAGPVWGPPLRFPGTGPRRTGPAGTAPTGSGSLGQRPTTGKKLGV